MDKLDRLGVAHVPTFILQTTITKLEEYGRLRAQLRGAGFQDDPHWDFGYGLLSVINDLREIDGRPAITIESFAS